ncbi:glycerol-3-phosphate 1-O-acyltransferase PlsB [Idiomarina seosinensis]|uniref:Glycerol-3-phosphate acyltransferase n=1 Tax=Idiomarina seosinensis TaxID=281739 RepID=A0A432ZDQ8_9GAMM|nr:glycerol-3-phosphate 1-O-acyltransferase PlsB [Idiomarina seosinensis]RUO76020.1 glycerol-3-phosphate 1-O-acyltransferase [Idiomarina seosinensis]
MATQSWLYSMVKHPLRWMTRFIAIADDVDEQRSPLGTQPLVYVMRSTSKADFSILQRAAAAKKLPDPQHPLTVNGKSFPRVMFLEQAKSDSNEQAIEEFQQLLSAHQADPELDIQVCPVGVFWGRKPGQEANAGAAMTGDLDDPGPLLKFWLVLFSGRQVLCRFSRPVSLGTMAQQSGSDFKIAHKLARVARVHFVRMRHAVAGPKLSDRNELMQSLIDSPALKKAVADEQKSNKTSAAAARKKALSYVNEIAANYSETLVRVLDRFMTWMWSRIYNGIEVRGGDNIRKLAQQGHEVIYVPCHRSHMDYLLLSYVIYKEGLVPPHIAAGVNLNFFPVGSIFRRGGAFFIRRSFRGNKLYSAVFREYLCWLFQKGYPVEYFAEGGRSRTGRLLPPKTGMLAMTVQGMLRGQQRPISLVPVYLGYEHIMEVSTYLKELKGKSKEKESMWKVLGSVRNLKNFGQGYVTFGQPINLKSFLDQQVDNWQSSITRGAEEPERPNWLTPTVNRLAETVMRGINDSAAANSVNLSALALLSSEHHALTREELLLQLQVYLGLLQEVPYTERVNVPQVSAEELWRQASRTDKFTIEDDAMGQVVSLESANAIAMTYYRNNILHLMIVPGIVATIMVAKKQQTAEQIVDRIQQVYPMIQAELFLSHETEDIALWVSAILEELQRQQLITYRDGNYHMVSRESPQWLQLQLLGRSASETLQRYSIVLELLQQAQPIQRAELERHSITLAERLSSIHGINAPEFYDKKVMTTFIGSLKSQQLLQVNDDGQQIAAPEIGPLSDMIDELIDPPVLQTIRQSVQQLLIEMKS